MINWLVRLYNKYLNIQVNVDAMDKISEVLQEASHRYEMKLDEVHRMIARDIAELEYVNAQNELILQNIIDCIPDMVWFKDTDGKYVYANKAIKDKLLLCPNPIGQTDVELAKKARDFYGAENHTFGEKCANSDKITLDNNCSGRFLESGKVKGKMIYLEVHKNVVRNQDNEIIGVCGSGRDMTEYIEAVNVIRDYGAKRKGEQELINAFDKYAFGEE